MAGGSVVVKGTSGGTSTDVNENFSISAAKEEALVFSFIGLVKQEIKLDFRYGEQSFCIAEAID